MLKKGDQKGFTLIEIIAVLVLLGILAAVAVPRFFDMQGTARQKAAEGIASQVLSGISMAYANALLEGESLTQVPIGDECQHVAEIDTDDFTITCSPDTGLMANIIVTVTSDDVSVSRTWPAPQ